MKKAFYLLSLTSCAFLNALPSQEQVVYGDVSLDFSQLHLQINAHGKAIIDWKHFDIAMNEKVTFHQLQRDMAVLNRVKGGTASQILGALQANCPIYIINNKGVYIGSSAQIQTAGFIASTADLSNDAFLSEGILSFENLGDGHLVNLGTISCEYGDILLIARSIDNQGSLKASKGSVSCVTSEVMVNPGGKQTVFIRLQEPLQGKEGIINSGEIEALSIDLRTLSPYQQAINHSGSIQAFSVNEESGKVYLVAEKGGCAIHAPIFAPSGEISIEADSVHLSQGAIIDVSSVSAPGIIHIATADQSLRVDSGAVVAANANLIGDGGSICLVADKALSFQGLAQVKGGAQSGNGGVVHLSSHGTIFDIAADHPIVDATALNGSAGTLILDPKFVTISPGGTDPATGQTFSSDPSGSAVISGAALEMALDAANVVIQANTDIVFEDIVSATTLGNGLTLQAGRSVQLSGQLTLNGGNFNATINDSGAFPSDREAGVATFSMGDGATLITLGGDINVDVGTFNSVQEGEISLSSALLDAGSGNISLTGFGNLNASDNTNGIFISDSTIQTIDFGTIDLNGTGGNGANINVGIYVSGQQARLQTENGQIHLIGQGGGDGTGNGNAGIYSSGIFESVGSGPILLDGMGGSGVHFNMGVILSSGQIKTSDSNLTVNGTGSGTGAMNFGIRLESQSLCESTGSGAIQLNGISGNGKNNNHGVILSGGALTVANGSMTINGTGQGSQNINYGIRLEVDSQCASTGTGPISLNGHNSSGVDYNAGVSISVLGIAINSGYGDIEIIGFSDATGMLNQGIRIEAGQVFSTGTGFNAADISLAGVGGIGTDYCNGVAVLGEQSEVSSVDGNIIVEGTIRASGSGNKPIYIEPPTQVNTTGTGTITYIEH